jgi:hypothetical protein
MTYSFARLAGGGSGGLSAVMAVLLETWWSTMLRSVVCGRCFGRVEGLARSGSHMRKGPRAALPGRRSITVAESVTKRRSEVMEVKADSSPEHLARVSQSRNRGLLSKLQLNFCL